MKGMLFTADCDIVYCNSPPAVAPRVGFYHQSWLISMSFGTWGSVTWSLLQITIYVDKIHHL